MQKIKQFIKEFDLAALENEKNSKLQISLLKRQIAKIHQKQKLVDETIEIEKQWMSTIIKNIETKKIPITFNISSPNDNSMFFTLYFNTQDKKKIRTIIFENLEYQKNLKVPKNAVCTHIQSGVSLDEKNPLPVCYTETDDSLIKGKTYKKMSAIITLNNNKIYGIIPYTAKEIELITEKHEIVKSIDNPKQKSKVRVL